MLIHVAQNELTCTLRCSVTPYDMNLRWVASAIRIETMMDYKY